MIISIDPHKNKLAFALWRRELLVSVQFVEGDIDYLAQLIYNNSYQFEACVVESMFIYPNERIKNPNDLLEVSKTVGLCHILSKRVIEYHAKSWKGQVPKTIMANRIRQELDQEELAILGKSNEHVIDAVGIGLFHLKRYAPRWRRKK